MFCTKCGTPIRDGACFCTSCGAPVVRESETDVTEAPAAVTEEFTEELTEGLGYEPSAETASDIPEETCTDTSSATDAIVPDPGKRRFPKKLLISALAVALAALLAFGGLAVYFITRSPLAVIAGAISDTFASSFELTLSGSYFDRVTYTVPESIYEKDLMAVYPDSDTAVYTTSRYRFILDTERGDGRLSRVETETDATVKLLRNISAALDEKDLERVAELLNRDYFERDVLDPEAFPDELSDFLTTVSDTDFLEEKLGFSRDGDVYRFKTDLKSLVKTAVELLEDHRRAFANKDYYNSLLAYLDALDSEVKLDLKIELDDGVLSLVRLTVTPESGIIAPITVELKLDDIGEAELDGRVVREFEKRRKELGDYGSIAWDSFDGDAYPY